MDSYSDKKPTADELEDQKILDSFVKDFKYVDQEESEIRTDFIKDKEFTWSDDQWEANEKQEGQQYVTVNKIQTSVRQVTNDAMQNKLAIRVRPANDKTEIKTAKVIQGMCRSIEQKSNASSAYQTAFEDAVAAGRGYFRILTRYRSPDSFDQEIAFKQVENALSVFFDCDSQEKDGSDAHFGGFYDRIKKSDFKSQWPDQDARDIDVIGMDGVTIWGDKDTVLIAEYFRCEYSPEMLYQVMDPNTGRPVAVWESEAKKKEIDVSAPLNKRKSERKKIMWYKVGAEKILQKQEWPGKYIPIVPVIGRFTNINGKRSFRGLTRYSKHSQKMYNFARSKNRDQLAMASSAPWVGPEGSFEGHETKWKLANIRRFPYLEYKPTTLNGAFAPAPSRTQPIQIDPAISQEIQVTSEEIKATTGIFDPGLGRSETDQSGKAVLALQRQGQTSTYDFVNNLTISIAHGGRILVDLIPKIYDTAQAVAILGEDEKEEIVRINDPAYVDPKTGKPVLYDLSIGEYAVSVDAGPSYATKRVEASESIMAFIGTAGGAPFGEVSGDILAGAMDWEGAEELSERYRKFMAMKYPGLIDEKDEEGKPVKGPDPQAMAQMQQMDQALQEAQAKIEELTEEAAGKHLDAQTKLEIAELDNATKIHIAKIQAGSQETFKDLAEEVLYLRSLIEPQGQGATAPAPGPQPGENVPAQAGPIIG